MVHRLSCEDMTLVFETLLGLYLIGVFLLLIMLIFYLYENKDNKNPDTVLELILAVLGSWFTFYLGYREIKDTRDT